MEKQPVQMLTNLMERSVLYFVMQTMIRKRETLQTGSTYLFTA